MTNPIPDPTHPKFLEGDEVLRPPLVDDDVAGHVGDIGPDGPPGPAPEPEDAAAEDVAEPED